jgi:adenylosuccinate synthase
LTVKAGWKLIMNSQYELPKQARAYVEFIEKFTGVPVGWIGVGPGREEMITRPAAKAA